MKAIPRFWEMAGSRLESGCCRSACPEGDCLQSRPGGYGSNRRVHMLGCKQPVAFLASSGATQPSPALALPPQQLIPCQTQPGTTFPAREDDQRPKEAHIVTALSLSIIFLGRHGAGKV